MKCCGAAWYNTWPSHFKEVECFQQQVEPILYKYGVDMVFTGHTHAYEVRPRPPKPLTRGQTLQHPDRTGHTLKQ